MQSERNEIEEQADYAAGRAPKSYYGGKVDGRRRSNYLRKSIRRILREKRQAQRG